MQLVFFIYIIFESLIPSLEHKSRSFFNCEQEQEQEQQEEDGEGKKQLSILFVDLDRKGRILC